MAFPAKPEAALASCFRNILQDMHPIFNSNDLLSFWDIDQELETLEKLLQSIPDVLNDAEWRSPTEGGVKVWMDDLMELLYRIEDFVDDMNIERVWIEKQLAAKNDHEAAKKYSIFDIQEYHTTKKKTISESIKKIIVKLEEVEKKARKLNLKPQTLAGTPVTSFGVKDGDDTGPLVEKSEIYGRQEDTDHVIKLLMNHNDSSRNYSVVSIVGMGGVGKTTLARLVFMDDRVKSHFDKKSWACVSDDFDFTRVVKEFIEYISEKNPSKTTTAALLDSLKGMVNDKKVLFVLDDMWTVEAWEKLKGAFTHCAGGSKILVTARNKNIGLAINDKGIYELQTLEDNYCWVLFKEKAFGGVVDERLERIGKKIVKKCKGVPLAVKVIGSSLQIAPEEMWESTLNNEIWESMDVAKDGIFPILKLSYHYLPSSLKRCFQYFALFPTDYWFKRDNLVRLWIAEGLIESREGGMLEDIGCSYYIELQRRCIIQEDGRMHNLLHSLACSVSGKFFRRSAEGSKSYTHMRSIRHLFLKDKEVNFEMFDKATNLCTLLVRGERWFDVNKIKWTLLRVLDLSGNHFQELPSSVGNLKHLRYLNLSWCYHLQSLPDSICELHNLQTLDLSSCNGMRGSALPTHMGNLQNLRFLSLSWMSDLSALPSSIVKLSNLLTLDLESLRELQLSDSSISCLPESICNIRNLRILDISNCGSLNSLPRNIGNLTCSQELRRFVVGREEGHGIEVLKDMNKLKGELVISCLANLQSVEQALMANLKKKVLDEIHFEWSSAFLSNEGHESHDSIDDLEYDISDVVDRDLEARVLDALEPHPTSLKSLSFLNYRGGRIPKCLSALSFPVLKKLVMKGLEGINRMVDLELPSLERLEIDSCLKLKDVSMGVRNLISLVVLDCRDLTTLSISPSLGNTSSSLASSILDLPRLKELTFRGCYSLRDICMVLVPGKGLKIYADHMTNLGKLMLKSLRNLTLLGGFHPGSSSSLASFKELSISSGCEHELISLETPNLEDLDVQECHKVKFSPEVLLHFTSHVSFTFSGDQLEALKVASLQNLRHLRSMEMRGIAGELLPLVRDDEAGSTSSSLPTLTSLVIRKCPNLTHVPKALLTIASLLELIIFDCPELESFRETGLPPLLQVLVVYRCKNLQYFPTGLNDHTSLRQIYFHNCEQVEARPDDGLPPNFDRLEVSKCPKLEQQIKQRRKDWLPKTRFYGTKNCLFCNEAM